jgi:hypothetical protein
MKRFLLAAIGLAALCGSASAQINFVPQPGVTSGYYAKNTFSSAFFGLVPPASATDMVCITGSASKVVRVDRIVLTGTAGTLVQLPVQVVRRATADTGGTLATTTANPGVTTQIASRDTGQTLNTSATAVLASYTAVPTINDAAPVYLDSQLLTLAVTSVATQAVPTIFDWSRDIENNVQVPTLRGVAQQLCVNFNAVSISSGVLNGAITWSEE